MTVHEAGGAAAFNRGTLTVPCGTIASGTGAAEYLTDYPVTFPFIIEAVSVVARVAQVGGPRTFRVIKNTSTVAASASVAATDNDAVGEIKAMTLATDLADRSFAPGDTLTVDVASGGTSITAGAKEVIIQYRHRGATAE